MSDSAEPTAYQRNVKEQYEALGRFVEAFEAMASEVREGVIEFLSRDGRHRWLIATALHHQNLTAKPLFDILRAAMMEIINDALAEASQPFKPTALSAPPLRLSRDGKPLNIPIKDRDSFSGVLNTIAAEFEDL